MVNAHSCDDPQHELRDLEQESSKDDQTKLALQESEARYRAIVEAFDGFIYVCSQDHRVEYMNERLIERTGYNAVGELCYKALHDRDSVCPWCVNQRVFAGETVRWEVRSPRDNRWYYIVNTPIHRSDGKLSKQAMILDITDRKRTEELLGAECEILEMVASGQPLQETLDRLNLTVENLMPGALCSIRMLNDTGERLLQGSAPNLARDYVEALDGLAVGPNVCSCGAAVARGTAVMVEDTATDHLCANFRDLALTHGLHTCWSVPFRDGAGKLLGILTLYNYDPHRTAAVDRQLVEAAAHLAGIAVERRRWEQELSQSEEKYRTLFEDSGDAITITSREGRFLDVNQAALDLSGYGREEMLNTITVADFYVKPSDRKRFQLKVERQGFVRNFEARLRKKNGTEMDCLLTSSLRRSKNGAVIGYQSVIRDITEFRRGAIALAESEARYRAVVEDQNELICRFLPGGAISFVNEAYCRYFGKSREDLVGKSFLPFIPAEDRATVWSHIEGLTLENPVASHEHRVIAPDGEIRWQHWTNRIVTDDRHRIIEYQAVGRDITERKRMVKALERSAEKIKLFAYSVSHDLKSPVVAMHGLTRLLHRQYRNVLDPKGKGYCDQIVKTAEQIAALVEQINIYVATEQAPLNIEPVALAEVLQTLKDEFSQRLKARNIRWVEPADSPVLRVDRMGLLRILRNLVDNALKYGGDELSEIRIGYGRSAEHHQLSVSDNGVGIKSENSQKIFDFFQRDENAKGVEGTGLGLAIVREIAERHGGRVWVESEAGVGTTFHVAFVQEL